MTLSCLIDYTGISAPTYTQILDSLTASYRQIFGSDSYLENDSKDYQLLAIFAQAINNSNNATITAYNSFSTTYAVGIGLSNLVKINGIKRSIPSNSQALVLIVGQADTTITNGQVADINQNIWNLPASVTIPSGGSITVTATAVNAGAIQATAGAINKIQTPTMGWQSVISTSDATPGKPVESDTQLRIRQANSTAIRSMTTAEGILGSILDLNGVIKAKLYINASNSSDSNGLPAHSIALVVYGGDATQIAQTLGDMKVIGPFTYGSTTETVQVASTPLPISFSYVTNEVIALTLTVTRLDGYTSYTDLALKNALFNYINSLDIGQEVNLYDCIGQVTPAQITGNAITFKISSLVLGLNGGSQTGSNITIPYNGLASILMTDISIAHT